MMFMGGFTPIWGAHPSYGFIDSIGATRMDFIETFPIEKVQEWVSSDEYKGELGDILPFSVLATRKSMGTEAGDGGFSSGRHRYK